MAAGLGFKTFTTGEVLTAADVNGYLMQGILVFATEAARNSAITSPQEGQFAFTKDNNSLWYYTGSAWVASGAAGDIEGVTAGVGISGGGTSGTVTITNDMATTITASGDIVVGTGSGTYDNLPIGTTGQVLTADTTVSPYKVKWATPSSGGGISWSLVNSGGTTLTGATTITVSSITDANKLMILIEEASSVNASSNISVYLNADTGANYFCYGGTFAYPTTYATGNYDRMGGAQNEIAIARMSDSAGSRANGYIFMTGGDTTADKMFNSFGMASQSTGNGPTAYNIGGYYSSASTISSVTVKSSTGNFDNGKIYVYKSA